MPKFGSVSNSVLAAQMIAGYWDWRSGGEEPEPRYFKNTGGLYTNISVNISDLQADQQAQVKLALGVWSDVARLQFSFTTGDADITYIDDGKKVANTQSDTFYDALTGKRFITESTVDVSRDFSGGPSSSTFNYFFQSLVHETGHALGLGHTGNYNASRTPTIKDYYHTDQTLYANDTWQWSVMSYNNQSYFKNTKDYVMTPQMADILAIQNIYGASTTRTGDSVYGFNSNLGKFFDFDTYNTVSRPNAAPAFTIYDSGGNDTLDCSEFTVDQKINIQAGGWSDIGDNRKNVSIYTTSLIENATGGSGDDYIYGNDSVNIIIGGTGFDKLYGWGGADKFVFYKGDTSSTRSTADTLYDFDQAEGDRVDFSRRDANSTRSGDQAFTFIGDQAFHKVAGELHYIRESSDTWIEGDTNGNGRPDFIIHVSDALALTATNFVL